MSKKTSTEALAPAGAAVPDITPAIPAHKRTYITRHGGSVVLDAPATAVHADAAATVNQTELLPESTHVKKP